MKKIEAIVKKSKFLEIKLALHAVGVNFFSYWTINAVNNKFNSAGNASVSTDDNTNTEKYYLSILVNDDFEEVTIKAILDSAYTGDADDGRIFISKIEQIFKIETRQQGPKTLR